MAPTVRTLMGVMSELSPVCHQAGCAHAIRRMDGRVFFVHEARGRREVLAISDEDIRGLVDIWGDQVKPWIERLHQEEPAYRVGGLSSAQT